MIDAGRLVALDTPAGLVARVDDRQRARFRPTPALDDAGLADLAALPEVSSVERAGGHLVVTGTEGLLLALSATLARHDVAATELRVEQASLDDAFVALTGHPADD